MDLRQIIMGDEDCLYLNVYTTKIELSKKRPVMVWIHGGAYSSGSGDATIYGPDYIVQKDVILVTLNYRLGVMGTSSIILKCVPCMLLVFVSFSQKHIFSNTYSFYFYISH